MSADTYAKIRQTMVDYAEAKSADMGVAPMVVDGVGEGKGDGKGRGDGKGKGDWKGKGYKGKGKGDKGERQRRLDRQGGQRQRKQ